MKTTQYVKKTKWYINKRLFFTKKFQGLVFSIDFDVPQGWDNTKCVFTFKFLFIGMWISFIKKENMFPKISKTEQEIISEISQQHQKQVQEELNSFLIGPENNSQLTGFFKTPDLK